MAAHAGRRRAARRENPVSAAQVAWIARPQCVGCALCVDACPFDAIAGVARKTHYVLPDLCTECALCLPACPVDCISLRPDPSHPPRDHAYRLRARDRVRRRQQRLLALRETRERELRNAHAHFRDSDTKARQTAIQEAVGRARNRAAESG